MSPGMVRTGGIMSFVLIGLIIVLSIVIGAASIKVGADGRAVAQGGGVMQMISSLIYVAIIAFVYWTTKGLFNAFGYRTGDIPIFTLIAFLVLSVLLGFVGGTGLGSVGSAASASSGTGIVGIISLIVLLIVFAAWLWFSIAAIGFGKAIGSGLWKAVGIVYLIGTGLVVLFIVLLILAVATSSAGLAIGGSFLFLIGFLVLLAGWICHGIGLITGASRMNQA